MRNSSSDLTGTRSCVAESVETSYAYCSWKTATPTELDGNVLLCPHCGGSCLHHYSVEVYVRDQDDDTGLAVRVGSIWDGRDTTVSTSPVMTYNPSPRRHGMRIRFWCESCHADLWLRLWQHKGQTMIDWDVRPWQTIRPNTGTGPRLLQGSAE